MSGKDYWERVTSILKGIYIMLERDLPDHRSSSLTD